MTFQSHLKNYGRRAISAMTIVALVGTLLVPLTAAAQNTKRIPLPAYSEFFGTQEQPNKPARTTVQVVLPAGDRGALVEIDVIAVRPQ